MSFRHPLAGMIGRPTATSKRGPQSTRSRYRPILLTLEALEARNLLSTVSAPRVTDGSSADFMYRTDFSGDDIRRANLDGSDQQTLVTGLNFSFGIALQLQPAPTVSCSVADSFLWPSNHRLVNVGLSVDVQPPDATLQVQIYANDNAEAADAADIGPNTLRLRAERQGHGRGRVYLIVVTAMAGGQSAFDVCAVVVPHDRSPRSIAQVQAEAASAEAYYREFQTAPPGYALIGEGPTDAGGSGSPNAAVLVAGLRQAAWTGPGAPAVAATTVSAAAPSTAPASLAVQPDQPATAQAVPADLPVWDNRQAQDVVFAGWETELN
jgi:hypothetical protein